MQKRNQTHSSTGIASGALPLSTIPAASGATRAARAAHALTKREQAVLVLIAFGLSNKEIARRLTLGRRTVESHVDHVLRKLDVPTRARAVAEAVRAGIIAEATASSPDAQSNNLPFQLTTLLGREQDLTDVKTLLNDNRLVCLSGPGGVGKTRVSLAVGVDLLDSYSEGVWFCEFSPISNPKLVTNVVAKVLGVREHPNRPLVDSIVRAFRRRHALLIFDNCEHVVNTAAELADEILHQCPNIRILVTSRQPLGIIGEVVRRLPSLDVPKTDIGLRADVASRYVSIALFTERAQDLDPQFALSNDNASTVSEICHRLDGIPLAIELAAARINAVGVYSLAQSLNNRFKVLTAGSRTALPRHKTLAALIDWSYDLLLPEEQKLFARMGIFAGSFSLSAATIVCAGGGLNESNISELLISLVDKSLVMAQTGSQKERYRLPDSTRAYAFSKLNDAGESEHLSRRHAEYFRDEALAADQHYLEDSMVSCAPFIDLDLDNYRSALEWGLTQSNDAVLGAAVAAGLANYWGGSDIVTEGRGWIESGLEQLNEVEHPEIAAKLWTGLGFLSSGKSRYEAFGQALALCECAGDGFGAAVALHGLAFGLYDMGRLEEASKANERSLVAFKERGYEHGIANCLGLHAAISCARGDIATSRDLLSQAIDIFRSWGSAHSHAACLCNLAQLEFVQGHAAQALQRTAQALGILSPREGNNVRCACICDSAAYQLALGELEEARESAREGLRLARHAEDGQHILSSLQNLALLAALRGGAPNAARLVGYVNLLRNELGIDTEPIEKWSYEKLMAELCKHLSTAEIARLGTEGAAWSEDRAMEEALRT